MTAFLRTSTLLAAAALALAVSDAGATTLLRNGNPVRLRRGSIYSVTSTESQPTGVFIVPVSITKLFRHPLANVDIDGAPPPQWHIPQL